MGAFLLLNIVPDIKKTKLFGSSLFKALVGGDAVRVEAKYREAFNYVYTGIVLFIFVELLSIFLNYIAGMFVILTTSETMGHSVAFIFAVVVSVGMYLPAPGADNVNVVLVNGNGINIPKTFNIHEGTGINR